MWSCSEGGVDRVTGGFSGWARRLPAAAPGAGIPRGSVPGGSPIEAGSALRYPRQPMDDTAGRDRSAGRSHGRGDARSIGILVMADDAPANVARLLDGMPERLRTRVAEVFLRGDGDLGVTPATSGASTAANHPPTLVHLTRQGGDGDTQKVAYRLAIEHGLGIMVVLRGVGPYLPGLLEGLGGPLQPGGGEGGHGPPPG